MIEEELGQLEPGEAGSDDQGPVRDPTSPATEAHRRVGEGSARDDGKDGERCGAQVVDGQTLSVQQAREDERRHDRRRQLRCVVERREAEAGSVQTGCNEKEPCHRNGCHGACVDTPGGDDHDAEREQVGGEDVRRRALSEKRRTCPGAVGIRGSGGQAFECHLSPTLRRFALPVSALAFVADRPLSVISTVGGHTEGCTVDRCDRGERCRGVVDALRLTHRERVPTRREPWPRTCSR